MFLPASPQSVGSAVVKAIADHLAGFKVLGVTRAESALPVGTAVTVIGELALAPEAAAAVPGAVRSRGQARLAQPLTQTALGSDRAQTSQM